jgi:uncharacterized membrane protein
MVKKKSDESESTIFIIMIITFIVCLFLMLFFISYLDQIYKVTEENRISQGELGSSGIFSNPAGNPILRSETILEERFGIYGTIFYFTIILLLIISSTYLIIKIKSGLYKLIKNKKSSSKLNKYQYLS